MKTSWALLVPLVLCAACASPLPKSAPPAAGTGAGRSTGFLVRDPAFTLCELESFVALTTARNAIVFGQAETTLLATNGNDPAKAAMIGELFGRMREQGLRNYPQFGAEKFYQCTEREKLPVAKRMNAASVCMARQDIPFYLYANKTRGLSQADAVVATRKVLANQPKDVYPDALIDELAPMIYRSTSSDGFFEIRRFMFESCLFPVEWKAWWEAVGVKER
jgi:hypothetical protein